MYSIRLCLLSVVVLSIIHSVFSACYECESDVLPACGDPINKELIKKSPCNVLPRGYEMYNLTNKCSKVKTTVLGKSKILRSCYYENPRNKTEHCMILPASNSVKYDSCLVCDGNLCNSSTIKDPGAVLIYLLTFSISIFLTRWTV